MSRIVVTGFGLFDGVEVNPSSKNLELLPEDSRIAVYVLPVSVSAVSQFIHGLEPNAVCIHFGVDVSREDFAIERFAYNEADFRIPDVDGIILNRMRIVPTLSLDRLETKLDYDAVAGDFKISNDPGRYICNYLYFLSLLKTGGRSLFIHCPPYEAISQDEQIVIVKDLIETVVNSLHAD